MSPLPSPATGRRRRAVALVAAIAIALLVVPSAGPSPSDAASAAAATPAAPAAAPGPHDFTQPIFSANARGDLITIGNVTTTCDPTYENDRWSAQESADACAGATGGASGLVRYDGAPMPPINNRFSMVPVDVDGDRSTFSSSTARLALPAGSVVLWAGLHWNAATAVPAADQLYGSSDQQAPPDAARRFSVRLRTPATTGYAALDAAPADGTTRDTWDDTNPGGTVSYGAYVDITDAVRAGGSGDYTVADVQACRGFGGCFGSWSITVAVADATMPPRNLNVWHGWQLTTPTVDGGVQEFAVAGITPPPSGPVEARIGVVQADGDRGLGPDTLEISSPSHPDWVAFDTIDRPLVSGEDDWFNSTSNAYGQRRRDADARPNLLANLNQDLAMVRDRTIIGNDDDEVRFRVATAGTESLYSQVVHAAVDLYAPEIAIDKAVDATGPVRRGDEVTWTLDVANAGIDPIRHAVITDVLPDGLTYVPGSIRYGDGGPADLLGTKTDAAGDDHAEWDPATRTLRFRVGTDAGASDGGTMGIAPAADGSHQITISYRTTVDAPADAVMTNPARAAGEGRSLDDPFGPIVTSAEDEAIVAVAPEIDLGITKTDDDAVVRAIGDRYEYRFEITNGGPSAATGVMVTDDLDPLLGYVSSPDGCTATDQAVTCLIGDLAAGATTTRSITVEVRALPDPGAAIPNLATVSGDQPDPDCVDTTPGALCNQDDEDTPRADDPVTTTTPPATTTAPVPTTAPHPPAPRAPAPSKRPTLARTGSDVTGPIGAGALLAVTGALALHASRRRRGGVR